jgi:hypothetical protein
MFLCLMLTNNRKGCLLLSHVWCSSCEAEGHGIAKIATVEAGVTLSLTEKARCLWIKSGARKRTETDSRRKLAD